MARMRCQAKSSNYAVEHFGKVAIVVFRLNVKRAERAGGLNPKYRTPQREHDLRLNPK